MLKFCSLYSGSSGNCSFIKSDSSQILIDAGVSMKKIVNALSSIGSDITNINAILVTHEHIDHVQSLGTLSKKYNIPVYANKLTWDAMPAISAKIEENNKKFFSINDSLYIGDICIIPFSIPHDAADPCGFNIFNGSSKISIATDIGHMSVDVFNNLKNSSFILLESNYEPQVLQACSYPYKLKSRIAGPNGHLSNNLAGQTISKLVDYGLKNVMLGHLSQESNFPELAYKTVVDELISNNCDTSSINVSVANRFCPSNIVDIS